MQESRVTVQLSLLVMALCLAAVGCSGGGGGGGNGGGGADTEAPEFWGIVCAATAGGASVRLEWEAAEDDFDAGTDLVYTVYVSATPGGQDFLAPVLATAPGATSATLSSANTPLIAVGTAAYFVVRATDRSGNTDGNRTEVCVVPVAPTAVAFVDAAATGTGTLGDPADPFPTVQGGVTAVEGAGGGAVLVAAAAGGTTYAEELALTSGTVSSIGIFGGFPAFAGLPAGATGADILATRDKETFSFRLDATGLVIADGDFMSIANQLASTFLDGIVFVDDGVNFQTNGIPAILAINGRIQISGCEFTFSARVDIDSSAAGNVNSATFVGNCFGGGSSPRYIGVAGEFSSFNAWNNEFITGGDGIEFFTGNLADFPMVPAAGSFSVNIGCNFFDDVSDAIDMAFAPADPANGGALSIDISDNAFRNINSDCVELDDLGHVGANGSASLTAMRNFAQGVSSDFIDFDVLGFDNVLSETVAHAGVGVDIRIDDNLLFGGNGIWIDGDLGVSALQTTSFHCMNNIFNNTESELIELTSFEQPTADDAADGGRFTVDIHNNLHLSGGEDINIQLGAPHGGHTGISLTENSIQTSEEEALNIDIEGHFGTSTVVRPFPDGLYCLTVFNNELRSSDNESVQFRDDRFGDQLGAFVFFGNNQIGPTSDPSIVGLDMSVNGNDGIFYFNRCFFGAGGQDSEEGIDLFTSQQWLGNQITFVNNTLAFSSGGGIEIDTQGPRPFLTNNSISYNGQPFSSFGIKSSGPNPNALIENCIVAFNSETDLDEADDVRAVHSLIGDQSPIGWGNAEGNPFYAVSPANLTPFPFAFPQAISNMFTLSPGSPAIDAGNPAPHFNDADGSRNDMGAFGGPGAGSIGILPPGTDVPLVLLGTLPSLHLATGVRLVAPATPVTLVFSRSVDINTAAAGISVTSGGSAVAGAFTSAFDGRGVTFTPTTTLNNTGVSDFVEIQVNAALRTPTAQPLAFPGHVGFAVMPASAILETEPNDNGDGVVDAADIPLAQVLPGVGPAPIVFQVNGAISAATDNDLYAVDVNAGSRLTVTADRIRSGLFGAVTLDLYDATGTLIVGGSVNTFGLAGGGGAEGIIGGDADPFVTFVARTSGTIYIAVSDLGASLNPPGDYVLEATIE